MDARGTPQTKAGDTRFIPQCRQPFHPKANTPMKQAVLRAPDQNDTRTEGLTAGTTQPRT